MNVDLESIIEKYITVSNINIDENTVDIHFDKDGFMEEIRELLK